MLRDLHRPRPVIFWTDFLVTIAVGYTTFAVYLTARNYSVAQAAAFIISGLAICRAVAFIHVDCAPAHRYIPDVHFRLEPAVRHSGADAFFPLRRSQEPPLAPVLWDGL